MLIYTKMVAEQRETAQTQCDADETVAESGVVGSNSVSESVAEVAAPAPARVDPMPLLHWVRRRFAAVFGVVAVLPDDSEHDAADDVPR